MAGREQQLALFPLVAMTVNQRLTWIRERLQGFSYRQAARTRLRLERRGRRKEPHAETRQVTLDELIARIGHPRPTGRILDVHNRTRH